MSRFSINRGDYFGKAGQYRDSKKKLIDLTNTEFESWIETPDKSFRYDLTVVKGDQVAAKGSVAFIAGSTLSWPVGAVNWFIKRTIAGASTTVFNRFEVKEL